METTVSQKTSSTSAARIRVSRTFAAAVLLLAGSLLTGFSMGSWLAPAAAWIGPVLLMRFSRDHKPGRGFLLVLAACSLAFLIGFGRIWMYFGPPMVPIFAFLYGFLWSLPYLADRLMNARLRGFSSTFIYPLAATALEFINIRTNPIGAWGATGFSQYGNLALMQLASVTGMIGITFLMGWFAAVANWTWENRGQPAQVLRGLSAFAVVLAAVYGFGTLRLNLAPSSATVRVAGITSNPQSTMVNDFLDAPDPQAASNVIEAHWESYYDDTVREAQAGAQVVVWPEASAMSLESDDIAGLVARGQELARQEGIYLTIPIAIQFMNNEQPYSNKLLLIGPNGEIAMEHLKYGGAIMSGNMIVGDGKLQTVETPYGLISGVMCWDMDYPVTIRQTGRNGTALLLVPSRDWLDIDPLHSQMAVFRAIENGVSVFRQVDQGLSIAVDPYGRVLAQTDFFTSKDRTLVAQMPVEHVTTLYTLFGSRLEWLAPIGLLAFALLARLGRSKNISPNL